MSQETTNNQVVVITGASSGFGRGTALRLASQGAKIVLAARRESVLRELAAECEAAGGRVAVVPVDVSQREEMALLATQANDQFGHVDVWINNAGAAAFGRFEEIPLEDHIQVIQTDLLGVLFGSYFAIKLFKHQGRGILINVSSVLGKIPMPYYSSYAAAKHGVIGLSSSIRLELEESKLRDIHVCTVMPASTDTPFFEHAANYSGHEFVPTPPVYDPNEVIDVLVKLCTEPEDEVTIGTTSKLGVFAHQLAPATLERHMAKSAHETLSESPAGAITEGSLKEPSLAGTTVHGSK